MAFNVGKSSKDTFNQLKKLTPRQRVDYVNRTSQGAAATLSMLTPQEFAELFPNYYKKGLPDVSGFREAISRKSKQKQDDINFGLSQGAKTLEQAEQYGQWRRRGSSGKDTGTVTTTTGGDRSISNKVMAKDIYNYLKSKGVDHVHAMGILANIQGESGFRPGIMPSSDTMRREGGASGGLFQHHDNPSRGEYRFTNMVKAAGGEGVWQKNWKGQVDFALSEPDMKKYLSRKFGDEREAVSGFIYDFERPADKEGDFAKRVTYLNSISSAVTSNDTPQTTMGDVSRISSKSGGYYGGDECVGLSKHFSGLGPASKWKFTDAKIVAGSVIATTSYGKGDSPGGRHARDMPDGKSHYHTGIALNSPDANGNVLILEQFQGQPARVAMVNIHNYRGSGERMAVVEGGDPSAGTMKAVEIAKGLANPDQLALIGGGEAAPTAQASAQVKAVQGAPTARPTAVSTEQQQQYPPDQQPQQQVANKQTATVEKVDKSKKTVESYKFDPDKYYNEVNTKHPEAKFFGWDRERIMKDTYKGFEEAQAAGAIKWDKKTNEIHVLDPNHEKVQTIYKDMQDQNIDRNAFLSKTEAGGSGSARVSKSRRRAAHAAHAAPDVYSPNVTETGLSQDSRLIDYSGSKSAKAIGITDQQYNAFREAVASIESSGGKYQLRGGSNKRFSGAYQIGGGELKEVAKRLGETAPTMRVKGKRTPVANEQFLNDPNMQERYYDEFNLMLHERLMKNKKYAAMSPEDKIKHVGMAHNAGAGGVSRYLRTGQMNTDKFGTKPQKYAHHIEKQFAGLKSASDMAMANVKPAASTPVATGPQPTTGQNLNAPTTQAKATVDKPNFLDPYTPGATASTTATPARNTPSAATSDTTPRTKTDPILTPQPDISTGVTSAPNTLRDTMQPAPDRNEQNIMNMQQVPHDKPQKETLIDASLSRQTREFPTDSLARAMGKARGFETGTGADGFHHSTTALG